MPRQSPNALIDIAFELDGQKIETTARAGRSALDLLRQVYEQTQIVPGCSPQGLCGCCTVIMNGKPRLSCTLRVKNLDGKSIQTIKSFSPELVNRLQIAFADHGAAQCGYCAPGILLQCAALLSHVPQPTDAMINKALNMHLCRCSGYGRIRSAVHSLKAPDNAGVISPMAALANLGKRTRVADVRVKNMHYAVPVFSSRIGTLIHVETPKLNDNARFFSTTSIFNCKDPLNIEHGGLPVGFVVATDLERARELATKFQVEMDASKANLDWPTMKTEPVHTASFTKGNPPESVTTEFKSHVETPVLEPGYFEPDAVVCLQQEEQYHLWVAGVNPHELKKKLMPLTDKKLVVDSLSCGGSFGGRNSDFIAQTAMFLSSATKAPISIQLTLEQAQRMHPKSPAQNIDLCMGLDASGKPLTLSGEVKIMGGAQTRNHSAAIVKNICLPYKVSHVNIKVSTYKSSHPPTALLRDKGLTGITIGIEDLINQAALHTGHDPLSYRARHAADGVQNLLDEMARKVVKKMPGNFTAGLGVTIVPIATSLQLMLKMVAGTGIEIHLPFPDSGQGMEGRLAAHAAKITGFGFDVFSTVCSSEVELLGNCKEVDLIPLALEALGAACSKMSHDLSQKSIRELDGTFWEGVAEMRSVEPQIAGAVCTVENDRPNVWIFSESRNPNQSTEGLLEGAAHMGLSIALGEKAMFNDDGIPAPLLRKLNFLKAKNSPDIETTVIHSEKEHSLGAAQMASSAAVCATAKQDKAVIELPLSKSSIARSLGIKSH